MCYSQNFSELQDVNSQLQVIKSELHDINSKLREIVRIARYKHESEKKSQNCEIYTIFSQLWIYISQFRLYISKLWEKLLGISPNFEIKSRN